MPFGALASPTGRFGDFDDRFSLLPESTHERGSNLGIDIGYYVSEFLAVGGGLSYARFPLDFGRTLEEQYPAERALTSIILGQAWARVFLPERFERWRPYAVVGIGVGKPKGIIEYETAFIAELPHDQGSIEVQTLNSSVKTTMAVSGGVGAMVPLSRAISLMIEPRYTTVSTEGSRRTDRFTTSAGKDIEIDDRARHNTNWWEIRGGLVLTVH